MPELASPRIVLSSPFRRARADASSRFHNFNSHRNRHPLETRRGGKEGKRGESRGKHGAEGGGGGGEGEDWEKSGGTLTRRR